MIRVFSGGKDAERETTDPHEAEVGDDRITQGFELLFGKQLREHFARLESQEARLADRLEAIESQLEQHEASLAELKDKTQASLEREQGEHQRRKGSEAELSEKLGQLRTALDIALEEIDTKLAEGEQKLNDRLKSLRSAQRDSAEERDQKLIEALSEDLHSLEASKVSRTELATLLANVARELTPPRNES